MRHLINIKQIILTSVIESKSKSKSKNILLSGVSAAHFASHPYAVRPGVNKRSDDDSDEAAGRTPLVFSGLGTQLGGCERWRRESDPDAFDLVEGDLVRAAVVEASGAGAFVVGHLLGDFEFAAVAEVFGDAGGTEAVAADLGFDAGVGGTSADHAVDVGWGHLTTLNWPTFDHLIWPTPGNRPGESVPNLKLERRDRVSRRSERSG